MAIKDENIQVSFVLPKELEEKVVADAEKNTRTRSAQIKRIVAEYYKDKR